MRTRAPPGVIRMAALWRPTLLAPTRSTLCCGSASSPRRSSSSRSTSRCSTPCAATAASAAPSRARSRGGRAHPVPGRRRAHRLRRRDPRRSASSSPTRRARRRPPAPPACRLAHSEPLQIEATGQQWLWRYDYPNEAFSYYKLVVPVDTTVELDLVSTDVIHTWDVPRAGRQARRRARQDQPRRLPRRRGRHLPRPVGDPLRPGLRGDADRGRSRLARGVRSLHQAARKPTSRPPRTASSGLIEDGETP